MKIYKSLIECQPLFRKGDRFVIIKENNNPDLMDIEAQELKWKRRIFGFDKGELEELK